jgi:hypothetical protein
MPSAPIPRHDRRPVLANARDAEEAIRRSTLPLNALESRPGDARNAADRD